MRIDDMDDYSVNLADAYARDAYQKGYEQGGMDAVKHGYWILKGFGNAECSVCGHYSSRVYDDDNADRYCRHCGAKMDGKEE